LLKIEDTFNISLNSGVLINQETNYPLVLPIVTEPIQRLRGYTD